MTPPKECSNCRFAHVQPAINGNPHVVCRRYPPTAVVNQESFTPRAVYTPVSSSGWCGEYEMCDKTRAALLDEWEQL